MKYHKIAGMLGLGLLASSIALTGANPSLAVAAAEDAETADIPTYDNEAQEYLSQILSEYVNAHPDEAQILLEDAQRLTDESLKELMETGGWTPDASGNDQEKETDEASSGQASGGGSAADAVVGGGSAGKNSSAGKAGRPEQQISEEEKQLLALAEQTLETMELRVIDATESTTGSGIFYALTEDAVVRGSRASGVRTFLLNVKDRNYNEIALEGETLFLTDGRVIDRYELSQDGIPVYAGSDAVPQEVIEARESGTLIEEESSEETPDYTELLHEMTADDSFETVPGAMVKQRGELVYALLQDRLYRYDRSGITAAAELVFEAGEGERALSFTEYNGELYLLIQNDDNRILIRGIGENGAAQNIYRFGEDDYYTRITAAGGVLTAMNTAGEEISFRIGNEGLFGDGNLLTATALTRLIEEIPEDEEAQRELEDAKDSLNQMLEREQSAEEAEKLRQLLLELPALLVETQYCLPYAADGSVYGSAWQLTSFGKVWLIRTKSGVRDLVILDPSKEPDQRIRTVVSDLRTARIEAIWENGALISEDGVLTKVSVDGETRAYQTAAEVLGADADGLTVGHFVTGGTGGPQYAVSRLFYQDQSNSLYELFRVKDCEPSPWSGATLRAFTELEDRFVYAKETDGAVTFYERKKKNPARELALGGPALDGGYAKAGMTPVTKYYAIYGSGEDSSDAASSYQDSSVTGEPILVTGVQIPVFSDEYDRGQQMNELFEQRLYEFFRTALSTLAANPRSSELEEITYDKYLSYAKQGLSVAVQALGDLEWADERYVSFGLQDYLYAAGDAHGMYANDYYTMDLTSGRRLSLDDVVRTKQEDLKALVNQKLQQQISAHPDQYYEEAMETAEAKDPASYRFYLTEDALAVEFGLYEIAPYSEGVKTVKVPYSELELWIVPGKGTDEEE